MPLALPPKYPLPTGRWRLHVPTIISTTHFRRIINTQMRQSSPSRGMRSRAFWSSKCGNVALLHYNIKTAFINSKHSFPLENHFLRRAVFKLEQAPVLPRELIKKTGYWALLSEFLIQVQFEAWEFAFLTSSQICRCCKSGDHTWELWSKKIYENACVPSFLLRTKPPDTFHIKVHDLPFLWFISVLWIPWCLPLFNYYITFFWN